MFPIFLIHYLKITALTFNFMFAVISIFSLFIAIFSWYLPPNAGISPQPVSDHHQYSFAVYFVGMTSISVFLLAVLGIISLVLHNSFCMVLYIIFLLIQISVQFILSGFAIANRHKIHETIVSQWHAQSNKSFNIDCSSDFVCSSHLQSLNETERIIFMLLSIFFSFQVILLLINCCYCNYLSEREQLESNEKDDASNN